MNPASASTSPQPRSARSPRAASVLLIVLVVIVLLALGAYTFSETMIAEYQAVAMHARQVESRALADSGVQFAAAVLEQRFDFSATGIFDNPGQFQDVLLHDSEVARGRGRFSVVTPGRAGRSSSAMRFGLTDESSKLNLNVLAARVIQDQLDEEEARAILLHVPRMTVETADAILDWMDPDELPRKYGAETAYYSGLSPPYASHNGPLVTLDDLLQVRGVTAQLLDGFDADRNGVVDPHEQPGGGDGPLRGTVTGGAVRGWRELLTVHSREGNLRRDGRAKINVNQPSLETLFAEVSQEYGDDLAGFIVSVREQRQATAKPPDVGRIESVYDLIGATFAQDGDLPAWESPWTTDPADLRTYLPGLLDTLTTQDGWSRDGRININLAPRAVLRGIPGMTDRLVEIIVAAQQWRSTGTPVESTSNTHTTTGWLLIEGHVDVASMRQLDRYITARGDVYSGQVIGYFDAGETMTRLEPVIDATYQVPRVVALRDLTELGPGITRVQLQRDRGAISVR